MAAPKNPVGKKNEKFWRDAISRAVNRREGGKESPKYLESLADKLVECGLDGDISALREIGDRLDGKVAQTTIISGDEEGGAVQHSLTVSFVTTKD